MNCKPNDLAFIVGGGEYAGRIVEVITLASPTDFKLPDGQIHVGSSSGKSWVVKSCGLPFSAPIAIGKRIMQRKRAAQFAVINDAYLRPIRPAEETGECFKTANENDLSVIERFAAPINDGYACAVEIYGRIDAVK